MSRADRVREFVGRIADWERRHGVTPTPADDARRLAKLLAAHESQVASYYGSKGICGDCHGDGRRQGKRGRRGGDFCVVCIELRRRQQNREGQRARRRAETIERRTAAGIVRTTEAGGFAVLQPVARTCRHCGEPFTPARTTAQFCSARCRVAHHRREKATKPPAKRKRK